MSRAVRVRTAAQAFTIALDGTNDIPASTEERGAIAAALSASDALLRTDAAVERVADILAYQHCQITNPKADDPIFGFHTFHPDQRAFLRDQQMNNARTVITALLGEGE